MVIMKKRKILIIGIVIIIATIAIIAIVALNQNNKGKETNKVDTNNSEKQDQQLDETSEYEKYYGTNNENKGLKKTKKIKNFTINNLNLYNDDGLIEITFDLTNDGNEDFSNIYMILYLNKDSERIGTIIPIDSIKSKETKKIFTTELDNIYYMEVDNYDFEIVYEELVGID